MAPKSLLPPLCLLLCVLAAPLCASEDEPEIKIAGATKHPIPLLRAAQNVSVLTRKDIEDFNPRELSELLRVMAGVDVFQKGADDFDASALGLNREFSNQMLVLIDGKPVMNSNYGHTWWREVPVPLDAIERIEVVKGPGSAQWGANAFAGVINIVTDHSQPQLSEGKRVTVRAGSNDYQRATVRVAEQKKDWGFTATVDQWSAEGNTPLTRTSGVPNPGFETVLNSTDRFTGVFDLEKQFGEKTKLSMRYSTVQNDVDAGGSFTRFNDPAVTRADINANYVWAEALHMLAPHRAVSFKAQYNSARTRLGSDLFKRLSLSDDSMVDDSYFDFDLQGRSYLGPAKYIYGLTHRAIRSTGMVIVQGTTSRVDTYSTYGQLEYDFDAKTQGFAGLILYDSSQTGFDYSPKLSVVRELVPNSVLRLGAGRAFRAPDQDAFFTREFNGFPLDLLNPGVAATARQNLAAQGLPEAVIRDVESRIAARTGTAAFTPVPLFVGNPNLRNETIVQIDAGYEYRTRRNLLKIDTWYSEFRHQIAPLQAARGIPITLATGYDFSGGLIGAVPGLSGALNQAFQNIVLPGDPTAGTFVNFADVVYNRGISLEVGRSVSAKLRLDANYTIQDLQLKDFYLRQFDDDTKRYKAVPFAPHAKSNVIARYHPTDRGTITGVLHHSGSRATSGVEQIRRTTLLPGFTTFDLGYRHELGRERLTNVSLSVKNLFDDRHQEFVKRLDLVFSPEFGGIQFDREWVARVETRF